VADERRLVHLELGFPLALMLRAIDRGLAAVSWAAAALVLVLLFAGPSLIGAKKSGSFGYGGSPGAGSSGSATGGGSAAGAAVFASAGCASCHTLKAAHSAGSIGPTLDQVRPSASSVSAIVRSGGGTMPSFAGKLTPTQIAAVAQYVSSVAGR
jgi:mono/diheme cytochrome c family protein